MDTYSSCQTPDPLGLMAAEPAQGTSWLKCGLDAMHVNVKGLGSRTKRLADGNIRYYATAWRTQPGESGAPVVAQADGRTLAEARDAVAKQIVEPAIMERIGALRAERDAKRDASKIHRLGSIRYIDGLVTHFLAYMGEDAGTAEAVQTGKLRRKQRKDIRGASAAHKANYRRLLENFREWHSDWRVSLFERAEIIGDIVKWRDQWKDHARTPDYAISAVSALFAWARQQGHTKADPTADIKALYQSDRSDIIWRQEHFDWARKNVGPAFFRLIRLAASIGLREGDLIRLPDSVVGAHSIARRTTKRGRLAIIPLTAEAKAVIADMRAAKAAHSAAAERAGRTPVIATTLAANENGRPWTKSGVASALRRMKKAVGRDPEAPADMAALHLHDLRGNALLSFRLAGWRTARLAMIFGWSEARIDEMLAVYLSGDDLARAMQAELELEKAGVGPEQEPNLHTAVHTAPRDG